MKINWATQTNHCDNNKSISCHKTRGMISFTRMKSYNYSYILHSTWNSMMSYNYFPKVLEGNKDRNSNVKHVLYGVLTRYLRFLPQKHQGEVCMRTEVFGVKQKPSKFSNFCVMLHTSSIWSLHFTVICGSLFNYKQRWPSTGKRTLTAFRYRVKRTATERVTHPFERMLSNGCYRTAERAIKYSERLV